MEFVDRVSAYPNRYAMTDENGNTSYVILEKEDSPVVVGTPLNAENMNNLVQKPQTIDDMDTMTSLFGFVTEYTKNSPDPVAGFAINCVFGGAQVQYIFYFASPGIIVSRHKIDNGWTGWSHIKFTHGSAYSEE